MTRAARAPSRRELPPPPSPCPQDLRHAPELAVLAVVRAALPAVRAALRAEHPSLADLASPGEPPTVRLARRLIDATLALSDVLDDYRRAALAAARRDDEPYF